MSATVPTPFCIVSYILYNHLIKETLSVPILHVRKLKHD